MIGVDTGALVEAIRRHRVVELVYRGDPAQSSRIVHPHVLFRTTTGGLCLEALQVSGHSASGHLPAWRQFHLMGILDAKVLDARFETAADFDSDAKRFRPGFWRPSTMAPGGGESMHRLNLLRAELAAPCVPTPPGARARRGVEGSSVGCRISFRLGAPLRPPCGYTANMCSA